MKRTLLAVLLAAAPSPANVFIEEMEPDRTKRALVVEVRERGLDWPVQGAQVRVKGSRAVAFTDSMGIAFFPDKVKLSQDVIVNCDGYRAAAGFPAPIAPDTEAAYVELSATFEKAVSGTVNDGVSLRPLPGARVWIDTDTAVADSCGRFSLNQTHISPLDLKASYEDLKCQAREFQSDGMYAVTVRVTLFDSTAHGGLTGRVIGSGTGEPLLAANVVVMGTMLGCATDADGNYLIPSLPAGECEVGCSYIGYSTQKTRVAIEPGRNSTCNFRLLGPYRR